MGDLDDHRRPGLPGDGLASSLRDKGIRDERVLTAMRAVPRERFLPPEYRHFAYEDIALPIGEGQTISQPFVVALMTESLHLLGHEKVLEIGTGSGYQSAILSRLADKVISLERISSLADAAARLLGEMGCANVTIHVANGTIGWPDEAPYDGIVVTAAAPEVPFPLIEQLAEGGRLVIPVGSRHEQSLLLITKRSGQLSHKHLGPVQFVPLVGQYGWCEETR